MKLNSIIQLLSVTLLISSFHFTATSQNVKPNLILFADVLSGHSVGNTGGFSNGAGLNYQKNRNLFTLRCLATVRLRCKILSPFFPLPIIDQKTDLEEYSVLYGWRFIDEGTAYSFSLGFSYNLFTELSTDNNNQKNIKLSKYKGVPFEANIKWFKKEKRRFRIYGLLPVGKPTALGGSLGFKIFGNLSKHSYAGLGITYGLGCHKKY